MKIRGTLLLIGGAEDKAGAECLDMETKNIKFKRFEILRVLLAAAKDKPIEIITTGSQVQKEVIRSYAKAFQAVGCTQYKFMPIQGKHAANSEKYIARIGKAGAVFLTGGDQLRLVSILGGTRLIDCLKYRLQKDTNFILAGTSAGAMAMGDIMLTGGKADEAMLSQHLNLSPGLGMLPGFIIDTHFVKRGRFTRLAHAMLMNTDFLGIGLGEDTALTVKKGDEAECHGSGMVIILDGKKIKKSNIAEAKEGEPIYVENLIVTILVKGCWFSLKRRKLSKVDEHE